MEMSRKDGDPDARIRCVLTARNPKTDRTLVVQCRTFGRAEYRWTVVWKNYGNALAYRECKSVHEAATCVDEWIWCEENWEDLIGSNEAAFKELQLVGDVVIQKNPKSLDLHGHPVIRRGRKYGGAEIVYSRHNKCPWSISSRLHRRQYRKTLAGAVSALKKML
jgi:hypothetical protein